MCLALPYRIVRLLEPGRAVGEGPEGVRALDISSLQEVRLGSYVLVAYGSAIRALDDDEAVEILGIWKSLATAEGS